MELYLVWIVAGFALVIAELMSGTFYLLVVALGTFAAALAAWLGAGVLLQAALGCAVALAGVFAVRRWHAAQRATDTGPGNFLDRGQPVVVEGWANEPARIARVRYRGTTWDARVAEPDAATAPGTTLYIEGQEGNTLVVVSAPPAR